MQASEPLNADVCKECRHDKYRITYKPAHDSATQITEINKLNKNTERASRTHILLKALMNDSLDKCEIERCNVSETLRGAD